MLQTGESQKSNENILDAFIHSQINALSRPSLVLFQVPKCFGLVQIFCARPKIYLHIVVVTNIFSRQKDDLHEMQSNF